MNLEKMPLPKFDDIIRNYPQFKRDFNELVLINIDSKEAVFTLRNCVSTDVRDYLGCCNDDVTEMFERLDIKYGDPCKIIESIVSQIHKFKRLDADDPKRIIQFVDMLEKAHGDLKLLGLETEIANMNTVSLIESKLPHTLQMEWYREIYKDNSLVNKINKFPHLLKFLITERNAMEYATSDLRKDVKAPPSNAYAVMSVGENLCVIHFWTNNHSMADCRTYANLTLENKYNVLNEKSVCYGCLNVGHAINECVVKMLCGNGCDKFHHPSLHNRDERLGVTDAGLNGRSKVLLLIMTIATTSKRCKTISCLWDAGADISFITNSRAKQLNLRGKPTTLYVTTAGGQRHVIDSMTYNVEILDTFQNIHQLRVYGIDRITGAIADLDLRPIVNRFNNIKVGDIRRPTGDVDIPIGYDYAGWHPIPQQTRKHLVILSNIFGKCVGRRCSTVMNTTERNILTASCVNSAKSDGILNEFIAIELLGVQCEPKCGNCKCGTCPIGDSLIA